MREVMGSIGQVLDDFGEHVEFRNTWGDALYAIIDHPAVAARVAISLQDRLEQLPPGLIPARGGEAGMRIGLHFGPIYKGTDRVTRGALWYGGEVNRTARIEPVTPVGGVYCTETFAAALVLILLKNSASQRGAKFSSDLYLRRETSIPCPGSF